MFLISCHLVRKFITSMKVSYTVWRLARVGREAVQLELKPSELLFVRAAPRQYGDKISNILLKT